MFCFKRKRRSLSEIDKEVTTINKRLDSHDQQFATVSKTMTALAASRHDDSTPTAPDQLSHLPKVLADYSKHIKLLRLAADIATAQLNCHRDTWAYLAEKAAPQPQHFRTPGSITDIGGRIHTEISGRSLTAILTALWSIAHSLHKTDAELVDWAHAVTLYQQIARGIKRTQHGPQKRGAIVVIVIDRRPATTPCNQDDDQASAPQS